MKDFIEYKNNIQAEINEKELVEFNAYLVDENMYHNNKESLDKKVDELIEKHTKDGKLDIDALLEEEMLEEGALGAIIGGIGGFALGKTIGKVVARVLGVEKGILYDLLTSRLVGAALGASIGKKIGGA